MSRIREIVTHYGQQDTVTCCQRDMRCVHALIRDTLVAIGSIGSIGKLWSLALLLSSFPGRFSQSIFGM